jgi:predicted nucleic acid-binding protein
MIAEVMLDTNVIVYAVSKAAEDMAKARVAVTLIEKADFGLSGQVLQEFYVTTTRRIRVPLSHDEALDWIESLEELPCIPVDSSLVFHGAETAHRYQISYWDGAIVAAAERLGATTLYSEDLDHGQTYGDVRVVNPFLEN